MILRPELSYQKLKRTVHIARYKTSVSLESGFWSALKEIGADKGVSFPRWSPALMRIAST
jgi:predicted DNA-binding ribbon-helix-helix protein